VVAECEQAAKRERENATVARRVRRCMGPSWEVAGGDILPDFECSLVKTARSAAGCAAERHSGIS
jgi:hypothetical protein